VRWRGTRSGRAALKEIDEHWNPEWPADWQRHYAALRELVRDEGQADILPGVTVHAMDVGRFVAKSRQHAVWQGLMDGQRELLEAIGGPCRRSRKHPPRRPLAPSSGASRPWRSTSSERVLWGLSAVLTLRFCRMGLR
jgi:Helicase associated domain